MDHKSRAASGSRDEGGSDDVVFVGMRSHAGKGARASDAHAGERISNRGLIRWALSNRSRRLGPAGADAPAPEVPEHSYVSSSQIPGHLVIYADLTCDPCAAADVRKALAKIGPVKYADLPPRCAGCTECSICFSKFRKNSSCASLSCSHAFHHRCIKTWLKTQLACPVCRLKIEPE